MNSQQKTLIYTFTLPVRGKECFYYQTGLGVKCLGVCGTVLDIRSLQ